MFEERVPQSKKKVLKTIDGNIDTCSFVKAHQKGDTVNCHSDKTLESMEAHSIISLIIDKIAFTEKKLPAKFDQSRNQ